MSENWLKTKVRTRLTRMGRSLADLAEDLGVSASALGAMLDKPGRLRKETIDGLGVALKVEREWFWNEPSEEFDDTLVGLGKEGT